MRASKRQLKERWHVEPSSAILKQLQESLFTDVNRSITICDIAGLLSDLPFREEVGGSRDFRGIALQGGVTSLDLSGCDFSYATLAFNFINCNLSATNFEEATLNGIISNQATKANFRKAKMRGCSLVELDAQHCCFDEANLVNASFERAYLQGSTFRNANCRGANFISANLLDCDFQGANLNECPFQAVTLGKSTNLRGASLVNLFHHEHRSLDGKLIAPKTDWRLANYDATTRYAEDPTAQAFELLDQLFEDMKPDQSSPAIQLRMMVQELKERLSLRYEDNWYENFLNSLPPGERKVVEDLFTRAIRNLL